MFTKRMLLAATSIAVLGGFGTPAQAEGNRLTVYEVNTFMARMTNAINSPNITVGKSFLENHVMDKARYDMTITTNVAVPTVAPNWVAADGTVHPYYYRYPHYTNVVTETGSRSMNKWEKIGNFETKKRMIPGFRQAVQVTNINMTADALNAKVDFRLQEHGAHYAPYAPYAGYVGYAAYAGQLPLMDAQCTADLKRVSFNKIAVEDINCRTVNHAPIL